MVNLKTKFIKSSKGYWKMKNYLSIGNRVLLRKKRNIIQKLEKST